MPEFIIGKCKCGGSVLAEFGFSCSGKPKTSMRCDRCGKVSITIGNNNNPMKLWEGKYSTEYIDREALMCVIKKSRRDNPHRDPNVKRIHDHEHRHFLGLVENQPTADVVEVRHGEWKKRGNEKTCSECKFIYYSNNDEWSYCPNCGAKMDGKGD